MICEKREFPAMLHREGLQRFVADTHAKRGAEREF